MRWNYLSIPKLQQLHHWCLGMDKQFRQTFYNGCNYLSMLGLKLNHVSKRGHWGPVTQKMLSWDFIVTFSHWGCTCYGHPSPSIGVCGRDRKMIYHCLVQGCHSFNVFAIDILQDCKMYQSMCRTLSCQWIVFVIQIFSLKAFIDKNK